MRFVWLLFAHVIGDIALQSEFLAVNKGKYWICLAWHSLIWTAIVCIALEYCGILVPWKISFLFFGHFFCDMWKCRATKEFPSWHLYVDQSFHLLQLFVVGVF